MKRKPMNLKERKEGYMGEFRGREGGNGCNYIVILKREKITKQLENIR